MKHIVHSEPGALMMVTGTVTSWFWVGIEWTNEYSGLFVAIAAIVSTAITVMGALKANSYRKGKG
tara:strand:- start:345 stop:539 length:195 start_codon:yes stop_codon:yes gene_type:complete